MENNIDVPSINITPRPISTLDVSCVSCGKMGPAGEFVAVQNDKGDTHYICEECSSKMNSEFELETKNPKIFPAILLGVLGGLVGGIIWYYVAVLLDLEIGYVAIGLGYLVGFGVYFGAGKKRGKKLQIISAVITILAIVLTESYIIEYVSNQYLLQNPSEFPDFAPGEKVYISIFNPYFWPLLVSSPISLIIYGVGIYFAYMFCKPKKI